MDIVHEKVLFYIYEYLILEFNIVNICLHI